MVNLNILTRAPKAVKTSIQIVFDATTIFGMLVLLETNLAAPNVIQNWYLIVMGPICFTLIMYFSGFYQSFVRFFTSSNMVKIFITMLFIYIMFAFVGGLRINELQTLFTFFVTTFSILVLPRVFLRELLGRVPSITKLKVAVLGTDFESYELYDLLKRSKKFQPILLLGIDLDKAGFSASGLNYIPLAKFINNHTKYQADIVAIPKDLLEKAQTNQTIELLEPLGIPLLKARSLDSLLEATAGDVSLVPLSLNDLTFREAQAPIQKLIYRNILGKTVLVTGGGGSIGSELCRQILSAKPEKLIILDCSEYNLYQVEQDLNELSSSKCLKSDLEFVLCSVRDRIGMYNVFENNDIDVVYHAAAFKHVPLVEMNPLVSFDNNVLGTKLVCELAVEFKVPSFTLISTDKAVNPTNFMGVTKRLAEMLCQAFGDKQDVTKFSIVRFGNVLGSSGSAIPKFEKQIKDGGPITVTHKEITRYFMSLTEAAQLVIQASAMTKGGDIFILEMGQPVKILDLAKRICSLRGLSTFCTSEGTHSGDIEIKITGLRVAEKLYEELLVDDNAEATEHPRIFSAQEDFIEL
ncbi:polysaccharide biosynthesis protein, partial [Planktomarina temperata]|nr:polysaccharide biosynthesis protein [Planktomarina temperata]